MAHVDKMNLDKQSEVNPFVLKLQSMVNEPTLENVQETLEEKIARMLNQN